MKKIYQNLLLVLIILTAATSAVAQHGDRCGTQHWLEATFKAHPELRAQYEERERKMGEAITDRLSRHLSPSPFAAPVVIPVVFHVVLTAGEQSSITDAKVLAQLATLNKDYGGTNPDSANVPAAFQAVRGHSMVSFCLAQRKPDGTATTGIDRVVSSTTSDGSNNDPIKSTAAGGASSWDQTKYINIWLGNFDDASLLGYATFPIGSPEGGAPASQQGVVVLAQSVPGGAAAPYNLGRTLTHELGHYFWLRHMNGDGTCANDFPNTPGIDDTPAQSDLTFGCPGQAPVVTPLASGCSAAPNPPGRMFQNYMDYTDDGCMTMFTIGQDTRIEMAINMYRPALLVNNMGCVPPSAANGYTFNSVAPVSVTCGSATAAITLGTTVTGTFTTPIVLTASGNPVGTTVTFGTNPLTPGGSTTVTLNNVNTLAPGSYNITVTGVAGAVTQTSTLTFTVTASPPGIGTQPTDVTTCVGSNAAFNAAGFGAGLSYQWQVSVGGGAFTDIAGAINPAYNIAAVTLAQNGNQYRVLISSVCGTATSDTALLTVTTATVITTQPPANVTACAGSDHTFSVVAGGTNIIYQWQVSITGCGGTFVDIVGANTPDYTLTGITAGQNGYAYRVVITSGCTPPTITSTCSLLTVSGSAPSITTQPAPVTVCAGAGASFNVIVSPLTGVTYQWQVSIGGGPFTDITGATAGTYAIAATTAAQDGNQYQAVITTTCGTITSTPVLLTVNAATGIVANLPASVTACTGGSATFTVTATGGGLSYHWQLSTTGCGGSFNDIPGAPSTPSYTVTGITAGQDGYAYRVIVIGTCAPTSVTSDCSVLTVSGAVGITTQPTAVAACSGSDAVFTVEGSGTGITYQWQVSTDGGVTFTDISGATSSTLTITGVAATDNNNQYQVILTSSSCATPTISIPALLTVNDVPAVTTAPVNVTVCDGSDAVFTTVATGTNITYQWQVSTDNGATFTDIPGATGSTYTVTGATASMNNYQYQVVISGTCSPAAISTAATLTISAPVSITTQPTAPAAACAGSNTTITVTGGGGSGTLTYQWQVSTDNGVTFTDIPGETNATLSLANITGSMNGNQYQVILSTTACPGNATSTAVTLTVNPSPVVTLTASPASTVLLPGQQVILTATVAPTGTYVFAWEKDGVVIPNTTATLTATTADTGSYTVTAADPSGSCAGRSNSLRVSDSTSGHFAIYPNPNSGQFVIAYPNPGGLPIKRNVTVFDSHGARVFAKIVAIVQPFELIPVDLKPAASGVYILVMYDASGTRLLSEKIVVRH